MLQIRNLHVSIEGRKILRGIDLDVQPGTVHAVMGPNGSGKSTLAAVLAGRDGYDVESGSVSFNGQDLLEMDPEIRAREGVFLAFQYPVEVPGVTTMYFMREAVNAVRKHRGQEELSAGEFLKLARERIKPLGMDAGMLKRAINQGFSGGEKKRSEVFQMTMLEPRLGVLDETDSGLDIDALRVVADGVNALRSDERAFVVITHYQRLLDYIVPDHVHVLADGRIERSGDKSLALELEARGYGWIKNDAAPQGAAGA
ncbi:MAG: Fe-S cluster assembly ATPase SufC [Bryobacterales bacterium]|nr:Fe-S cluster assembly ATPase SufC [Bryobacterales bacterium]